MAIVMIRNYEIDDKYSNEEKEILRDLIDIFRVRVADHDAEKNILNGKELSYSDPMIIKFLESAALDINAGIPRTNFTVFELHRKKHTGVLMTGAIIMSLMHEGLLQLKNQANYSDSGLSIQLFDKSTYYQSWLGILLNQYEGEKRDFKASVISSQGHSIFYGVATDYGRMNSGGRYY